MKHQYKVDIRWSDEDQAWIARVPELDGVLTHGDTVVEAAEMAEEAISLHLESLKAHKIQPPEPAALKKLSGNYPLRMGKERHMDVVIRASQLGMSLNEYLTWLIDREDERGSKARAVPRKKSVEKKKSLKSSGKTRAG